VPRHRRAQKAPNPAAQVTISVPAQEQAFVREQEQDSRPVPAKARDRDPSSKDFSVTADRGLMDRRKADHARKAVIARADRAQKVDSGPQDRGQKADSGLEDRVLKADFAREVRGQKADSVPVDRAQKAVSVKELDRAQKAVSGPEVRGQKADSDPVDRVLKAVTVREDRARKAATVKVADRARKAVSGLEVRVAVLIAIVGQARDSVRLFSAEKVLPVIVAIAPALPPAWESKAFRLALCVWTSPQAKALAEANASRLPKQATRSAAKSLPGRFLSLMRI
jgi:hypothetical protein